MEAHALEASQQQEAVDVLKEALLVVLLDVAPTPELIGDDLGQYSLAERRDTRDRGGQVD